MCFLSICMSFIIKIALGLSFCCSDLSFNLLFWFSFAIFEEHSQSVRTQNSSLFFWFIFFTFFKVRKVSPQEQKSDLKTQFSSIIWFPIFNHLIHLEYFWRLAQMPDLAASCSAAAGGHAFFTINLKDHLCVPWVSERRTPPSPVLPKAEFLELSWLFSLLHPPHSLNYNTLVVLVGGSSSCFFGKEYILLGTLFHPTFPHPYSSGRWSQGCPGFVPPKCPILLVCLSHPVAMSC